MRNAIRLAAAIGVAWMVYATNAQAAPVTFQFNTTVTSVGSLSPAEIDEPLPFTISEGDSLSGTFRFEPTSGTGVYPQVGQLQLLIGAEELSTAFEIRVTNDGLGVIDTPGRIADPGRAPSVDRALFVADRIAIVCPTGSDPFGDVIAQSFCGTVTNHDAFKFSSFLIFEDDQNLQRLMSADLPSDAIVWNSLKNRELSIRFNNGTIVGAYISAVRAIPEPDVGWLITVTVLGAGAYLNEGRRHSHQSI